MFNIVSSFDNVRQYVNCGQRQLPSSGASSGCQLPQGRDGSLRIQSLVEFLISSFYINFLTFIVDLSVIIS